MLLCLLVAINLFFLLMFPYIFQYFIFIYFNAKFKSNDEIFEGLVYGRFCIIFCMVFHRKLILYNLLYGLP